MYPFPFPGHSIILHAPKGWEPEKHGPCVGLPVTREGGTYTSFWKLTWRERFRMLFGAGVWLTVVSIGHPPVRLTVGPVDGLNDA